MFRIFDRLPAPLAGLVPGAWVLLAMLDAWIFPGALLYWVSTLPSKGDAFGAVVAGGSLWWGLAKTWRAVFSTASYRWTVLRLGKWGLILVITAGLMKLVQWAQT